MSMRRSGRIVLVSITVAVAVAVVASPGAATKYFDSFFGGTSASPALGGTFGTANSGVGDIAVNSPSVATDGAGQSGWIYVVDRGNNRIQAFDSTKAFQFAIGRDVVQPGGTGDTSERQTVTVGGAPTGGTFTLTFAAQTTAPIAFDATAASVQSALEALAAIGVGNVAVTGAAGGPYTVDFIAARASVDQAQMTATAAGLTPSGTVTVATTRDGASFEKCTVAAQCKVGTTATTAATSLGNAGSLNIAQGLDVDQATGHLFVVERTTNRRIQQFTANGDFVRAFGWDITASGPGNTGGFETCNAAASDVCQASTATGTADGQLGSNTNNHGLAVAPPGAPNAGQVYVADPANQRVQRYTVPASSAAAVAPGPRIGNSGGSTALPSTSDQFVQTYPREVAVGLDGVVYATNTQGTNNAFVNRYDVATSSFLQRIEGGAGAPLAAGATNSLDVDAANGHLLVGRPAAVGLMEFDVAGKPTTVDSTRLVDTHAVGLGLLFNGVAVNPSTGRYYVSTSSTSAGTGTGHRVVVLDDSGVDPPPTVVLLPPTNVQCSTATLQAQINPNGPTGFQTNYRFQVSKTGAANDWTDVTVDQLVGDGSSSVLVDDEATQLEANTIYRVRVRTTRNPAAGVSISAELVFVTDPCPPSVDTLAAQQVSDMSARLVGRVNPNGKATRYWFEWGDNDYGNTVPVPAGDAGSGSVAKLVDQLLTGLDPETTYHFRLCAQSELAATPVCGGDRTVVTRSPGAPSGSRVYEMVTSPDKALRRGGERGGSGPFADIGRFQGSLPSVDGDSATWSVFAGVTDPDAGNHFAHDRAWEIRRRGPGGWIGEAVANIAPVTPVSAGDSVLEGISTDLNTQAWFHQGFMFPVSKMTTRVMGATDGPRGGGWHPFLDPAWYSGSVSAYGGDRALVGDEGERALRWAPLVGSSYRDVRPADDTVTPAGLTPAQTSGSAVFMTAAPTWAPLDLINECTGAGASATELPARTGSGVATDVVGVRSCGAGSPTSVRGAAPGSGSQAFTAPLGGTATTAMSRDGSRVFFLSPDPTTSVSGANGGNGQTACADSTGDAILNPPFVPLTGALTQCPPQLYVRQYDDQGVPTVRWISRAADALFNAPQRIGEMGAGVAFEGASADGQVVYFRTNAPLTADDPNGGNSITTGSASPNSWDLYRYELPGDNNVDPAGGTLTRVSAGPSGTADPNTNCPAATAGVCSTSVVGTVGPGGGAVGRFMSDDGSRLYLVTTAPIPGASNGAPAGGATAPGGTTANTSTRNLYLYDNDKVGSAAYEFVAQLPFGTSGFDTCSTYDGVQGGAARRVGLNDGLTVLPDGLSSCMRGSSSGDAVLFESTGQLSDDDVDSAADVYLYDASADRLTRISAPPASSTAYPCMTSASTTDTLTSCNGDMGFNVTGVQPDGSPETVGLSGLRHHNLAEDADGKFLGAYFESRVPLVEADTNDMMDVYGWRDGRLTLISPGQSDRDALYTGNSRDGESVFFWTEQRIDPREIDPSDGDLYVARVGGGFPVPTTPPPSCAVLLDVCQGPGGTSTPTPTSTGGPSDGNADSGARPILRIAAPTAAQRKQAARSGVLTLSVRADRATLVSATARAKLGGRTKTVARGSKRVAKGQVAIVRLRLSKAARSRLAAGRLSLSVTVRMPEARARTVSVVLRRAGK